MSSATNPDPTPTARRPRRFGWRWAAAAVLLLAIPATCPVDPVGLVASLRQVDPASLTLAGIGFLVVMAAKSRRWQLLLRGVGIGYPLGAAYRSYLAAYAVGIVTPARLGEFARAFQLRHERGGDLRVALRTVLSDRLLDLLFLAALAPFAIWTLTLDNLAGWAFGLGTLGLFAIGCAWVPWAAGRLADWHPGWNTPRRIVGWLGGLAQDFSGPARFWTWTLTVVAYLVYFAASFALMRALDIALDFRETVAVTACLSVVVLLPISVAGLGTREVSLLVLLGHYGVTTERALAYSLLQFGVFTLFGGFIGALAWLRRPRPTRFEGGDRQPARHVSEPRMKPSARTS